VRPWIFIFRDRVDAGRRLPKKLKAYQGRDDVMVLGLARGGAPVAKKLVEWNPKEPGFFIELAYPTRRAESIRAAHAILTRAASLHPTDATIQFNLACYEAQMGRLSRAKAYLKRATEIDAKFRLMALEDPDLVGIVGHGPSRKIIEIRQSKKFKHAWVAFEAPRSRASVRRARREAQGDRLRVRTLRRRRRRGVCIWRRRRNHRAQYYHRRPRAVSARRL
jgi:tetratricopeptide (TPR) repeat protein